MLMDELFHDDDGYGHYVDPETDIIIKSDFYKKQIKDDLETNFDEENIEIITYSKYDGSTIIIHVFYLCIIGYLSYSLLFKKL